MKPARPPVPLRTAILLLSVPLVALPAAVLCVAVMAGAMADSGIGRAWAAALAMLTVVAAAAVYLFLLLRLIRRRIGSPLGHFNATLEDIAEGFILDRVPEELFRNAEPGITEAFRRVIHINRMLLKHVSSLELGFEEERQAKLAQQALTLAYQRFVPKDFISFLQKSSITEVGLGDHVRTDMSILISDIRSFTSLSEKMTPEETFNLINDYLYVMEPVVNEHHGFIDKYMGDSVMALFPRSPDHAVRAALGMLARLRVFNAGRAAEGRESLSVGIGINTGSMMLGIVGGENRMEGTVISDAVNLAARMEDLNKIYGTSLLISESTYAGLEDPSRYAIRRVDRVQAKGKSIAVDIFEVIGPGPEAARPEHPTDKAGESA